MRMHSESSRCWRDMMWRSSSGSVIVTPSAMPRGMIVILCSGIGLVEHVGEQRVAALVEGDALALVVLQDHRVALLAHQDAVARRLEVLHARWSRSCDARRAAPPR